MNPLMLALLPMCGICTIADGLRRGWWRGLAAFCSVCVLLWSNTLVITIAALVLLGVTVGRNWRFWLGGVLQSLGLILLFKPTAQWNDPRLGASFSVIVLGLLITGALLNIVLAKGFGCNTLALAGFVPLLRSYTLAPFDWRVAIGGILAALFGAFWLGWRAWISPDPVQRHANAVQVGWLVALLPTLIASEAGITATWVLLLATSVLALTQRRSATLIGLLVIGLWFTSAALLAGGVPIVAALVWLFVPLYGVIAVRTPRSNVKALEIGFEVLVFGVLVLLPKILDVLLKPLWKYLGAGLTPFGQVQIQPWFGFSVRNAGSQTVATLPLLIIAGLLVVAAALSYATQRWRKAPLHSQSKSINSNALWRSLWRSLPFTQEQHNEL